MPGDVEAASLSFIKPESRRLLFETTTTKPSQPITQTWTVNVKNRRLAVGEVGLKPQELNKLDWNDRLTLELDGAPSALGALEITPMPNATPVFLASNFAVVAQDDKPGAAWGQVLPRFFGPPFNPVYSDALA